MKSYKIFDLDGTTIDSYHRVKDALKTGKFCLTTYINKCNAPHLIKQDTLLPLAKYMQDLARSGEDFAIITARHCTRADLHFLENHGLVNHKTALLSRDTVHQSISALNDAEYKRHQLRRLKAHHSAGQQFIMFDDMPEVINGLSNEADLIMVDAVALNAELKDLSRSAVTAHLCGQEALLNHYAIA